MAGAAFPASGCTFAWHGQHLVAVYRDWMLSSARLGSVLRDRRSTLEMPCRFRSERSISCIWVYVCVAWAAFGSCLQRLDVVERAAGGPVLRDRRSTLEMPCTFHGARRISCIWVYVCVAWAAFGSCLKGLDASARLVVAFCVTGAALWRCLANFVACAAFPASYVCVAAFGGCLEELGVGCCRARGCGPRFA